MERMKALLFVGGTLGLILALGGCRRSQPKPPGQVNQQTTASCVAAGATRGALVQFITYEAEDAANKTNGTIIKLAKPPSPTESTPEWEASGRAFVELRNVGDYIEFRVIRAANGMVIRHCIPDDPNGGGITATLGLYVNGRRVQDIKLSSKHNWLYGNGEIADNGQSNKPNEFPHAFWDESRLMIAPPLVAGDTLRLQKDANDAAAFYRIDLVELEQVAATIVRPAGSLCVADYGAGKDDAIADTAAIQKCLDEAKAIGKIVYIPAGTYLQSKPFRVDSVRVQGAGMWYTNIQSVGHGTAEAAGASGFQLLGKGSGVSDLYIDSLETTDRARFSAPAFTGAPRDWSVRNVWITHADVGFWIGGVGGVVSGCRVRFTYADGININNGRTDEARGIVVENNHIRGTGDDGLAILANAESKHVTQDVTLRANTVVAAWWGCNYDLAGGFGHVIEDNLSADSGQVGLAINLPGSYPMHPLTGAVVRRNTIVRGGSNFAAQRRGAVWVFPGSTSISGTIIEDNQIIDPVFRGIHLAGSQPQEIIFRQNVIDRSGQDGICIEAEVKGSGQFVSNTIRNLGPDRKPLANGAKDAYKLVETGNSWQK